MDSNYKYVGLNQSDFIANKSDLFHILSKRFKNIQLI